MSYEPITAEDMIHNLFGGVESKQKHHLYKVYASSFQKDYHCSFEAYDQETICIDIPTAISGPWTKEIEKKGIFLSDKEACLDDSASSVHLLIGADIASKLFTGKIVNLSCGLVAMETLLGWSLMGKLENEVKNDSYMTVLSLHVNNKSISDLWSLDTLGILDTADKQSQMEIEKETKKLFLNSVKQNGDGRYVVSLSWLEDHPVLPSNKGLSEKRLKNTVDRIKTLGILRDYENVFEDWKKEGATLNHLLDGAPDCYKMTAQHLQKSMYVDNCVVSLKSEADLTKFINESREIMALGKFELRGWQHDSFESLRDNCNESQNASPILQDIPVLVFLWNIERDTLKIDVRNDTQSESVKVTKRYILSKCHKIFDPIGITAPHNFNSKNIAARNVEN
ncbi:hypothetical protein CDAR_224041 [Caerostris darwini]|uniref:Peptidase aspartic putative domain-containing protein n=1 Tax=Caerostris darwini TaxID=1538125 RepID=A0AAV4WPL2_9ARAC|nr:hypothetical protein CDAR_224041 [Caerostris darwini]